jgi:hypothetical protein
MEADIYTDETNAGRHQLQSLAASIPDWWFSSPSNPPALHGKVGRQEPLLVATRRYHALSDICRKRAEAHGPVRALGPKWAY